MTMDTAALCELCDLVCVAIAYGPVLRWLEGRLGGWTFRVFDDASIVALPAGSTMADIRIVYAAHVDELGGMVGAPAPRGAFLARACGSVSPELLAQRPLVAMDYLDEDGSSCRPCSVKVRRGRGVLRPLWSSLARRVHPRFAALTGDVVVVDGDSLVPYSTVFTFQGGARVEDEVLVGKALDARTAVFAVVKAARELGHSDVGLLLYSEEGSNVSVHRAGIIVNTCFPGLELLANCDAVDPASLSCGDPAGCVVRLSEGGDLISPHAAFRLHAGLRALGVPIELTFDANGSKTRELTSLTPTLSLGIPCEHIHTDRGSCRLAAIAAARETLLAIPSLWTAR